MSNVNAVTFTIVIVLFLSRHAVGFGAARWRRSNDMMHLDEWGLGGRGFGTWVTWFLLGGDLYTAYTFVAVPAAVFAAGAVSGFFAVPYTVVVYPDRLHLDAPALVGLAPHGFVTPADFVRGRFGSRACAGRRDHRHPRDDALHRPAAGRHPGGAQVMGVGGAGNTFVKDLPLFIAFVVLAAYTYQSGLRARR